MTRSSPHAFTLVELLLVVTILAALAATAASLGTEVDQQVRYEDTKARRELIRAAIVGDPSRTANGRTVVAGFVADMGRLPENVRELISYPDALLAPTGADLAWRPRVPPGSAASPSLAAGWRGPYLRPQLERDASGEFASFRDGYKLASGNEDDDFGWAYAVDPDPLTGLDAVTLSSFGSNGAPGPTPAAGEPFSYAWDQPLSARTLVAVDDYLAHLGGLRVEVENTSAGAVDLSKVGVLVLVAKVPSPSSGETTVDWRPATREISAALDSSTLTAGATSLPLDPTTAAGEDLRAPWGDRALVLVELPLPAAPAPPVLLGPIEPVTLYPRASSLPAVVELELKTPPST